MHSTVFEEVDIAVGMSMTPAQFRELPVEQRAEMIAHRRVVETRVAYQNLLDEEEMKRNARKK